MTPFHRNDQASAELACSAEAVYEILIDYDSYRDWMPHIRNSALLAKAGELAIARLDLADSEEHISLECIHTTNRAVLCRVIEGDVSLTQIEWELEDAGKDRCRVNLAVDGDFALPLGGRHRELLDAGKIMAGLQSFAAAYASELVLDGEAGELILEIFDGESGLSCVFNGQQYELKPMAKERK
jgi:ribosome-associated toxin RatA of RatAB toxin-antitoxin module